MRTRIARLTIVWLVLLGSLSATGRLRSQETGNVETRPNILWLSTEDIGPHLGCYGDPDAVTPNLDNFAKQSLVYDIAWSNYPVCAPARTTIIAGMYASASAAGNMRSEVIMPPGVEMFPHLMRQAGYYCTNNSKTDYNYANPPNQPWDESSTKAHWKNRREGQPFFAVFNHTGTHESKIRSRPHDAVIDPAGVTLPTYWPDVPEVRQDWAQYHDNISNMDVWFQKHLDELEAAGLADNTIVLFFGDHGSGMPRHKRFAGDSGMRVPFVIHVPEKLKSLAPDDYVPGGRSERPVGFVDLAPTMLSILGIQPPDYMQGHAIMGKWETAAPRYCYGFRDRMDERPDISRSLRDQQYIYVRNYMPHLPAGQHVGYQFITPTTRIWKQMFDEGKLNSVQSQFWQSRPPEELYDLKADPFETKNLADDPRQQETLVRFRKEHCDSMIRFGDLGLVPESIAYQFGLEQSRWLMNEDNENFPLETILYTADHAANFDTGSVEELVKALDHESASVRYWGVLGLMVRGEQAVKANLSNLEGLANSDSASAVKLAAGEALATFGDEKSQQIGIQTLMRSANLDACDFYTAIHALNAIDRLDEGIEFDSEKLQSLPRTTKVLNRGTDYVQRLLEKILK